MVHTVQTVFRMVQCDSTAEYILYLLEIQDHRRYNTHDAGGMVSVTAARTTAGNGLVFS